MNSVINLCSTNTDYEDLFLYKRRGHLGEYAHAGDVDYFDLLIRKNKHYYLASLESKIISKNIKSLSFLIGGKVKFIEIGPGPEHSINTKVVPFLKGMQDPVSYTATDINIHYAEEACFNIKKHLPTLETEARQLDCSKPYNLPMNGKKCILFFGSTICNFTDEGIRNIFANFYNALQKDDFLVFSVDYNHDINSLKKAYDNIWAHKLTLAIIFNFQNIFCPHGFNAQKFIAECEWNAESEAVHMNVVATEDQNFVFNGHEISISKGDKYHVLTSRKFRPEFIESMVTAQKFKIRERFFDKDQKLALYLVQK